MMRKPFILLLALFASLLFFGVLNASAQTGEVYVTVQDNVALRAGPGRTWDRLAVLPFGTTYRATGRTIDNDWIQVAYTGALDEDARTEFTADGITYGWVASHLLIWTGNVLNLRIDGVAGYGGEIPDLGVTIVRAQGPLLLLTPETEVYLGEFGPATQVPSPTPSTVLVEATGRIGTADIGAIWLQFKYGGQFYWMSLPAAPGSYLQLPDASYLFPYSRLISLLRRNLNDMAILAADIGGRWSSLSRGGAATCNQIPEDYTLIGFTPGDLAREPIFAPVGTALVTAQNSLNAATASFRIVCGNPSQPVAANTISESLAQIAEAERNLNLARALLLPLQIRDPIAAGGE